MLKTGLKTVFAAGLIIGLCVGCAKKPMQTVSLAETQAEIINCSETYIKCLEATRTIEGDFDRFELEVNKCIEAANNCP